MRGKHYPFFKEGIWRPTHSRDVAAPSGARQARPRLRNSRWSPQPQLTHGRHCPISTTTRLRACSCLAHSESGELIRCTLTGVPGFGRKLAPRLLTGSSAASQGGCNGRAGDDRRRGRRRITGETRLRWDVRRCRAGHRDPCTLPTWGGGSPHHSGTHSLHAAGRDVEERRTTRHSFFRGHALPRSGDRVSRQRNFRAMDADWPIASTAQPQCAVAVQVEPSFQK